MNNTKNLQINKKLWFNTQPENSSLQTFKAGVLHQLLATILTAVQFIFIKYNSMLKW